MQSASNSGYVVLKVSQTEFGILPDKSFEYKDSEVNFFSLENSDGTVPDKKLWSSFNPPVFFLNQLIRFRIRIKFSNSISEQKRRQYIRI